MESAFYDSMKDNITAALKSSIFTTHLKKEKIKKVDKVHKGTEWCLYLSPFILKLQLSSQFFCTYWNNQ